MGWFLWGIALGWSTCAVYYYSQTENSEKTGNGAAIIAGLLLMAAVIVSINLGIASGTLGRDAPTPTSVGR